MMFYLQEKGFSIVQGLMLAGLLSGSALVTSQLVSNQKKVATSVESKDAIDELAELAYILLQNKDNCFQTLTANGVTGVPLTGRRVFNNLFTVNRNATDTVVTQQAVLTTGRSYFANNISISEMAIDYKTGNLENLSLAEIDIRIRRNESNNGTTRTKDGVGSKDFSKKINIVVQRNPAGQFLGCYAVKDNTANSLETGNRFMIREFCTSLAPMFRWDGPSNLCVLEDNVCPAGQFFSGLTSVGIITDLLYIQMGFGGVPIGPVYGDRPGISSVGRAHCRGPKQAFHIRSFINTTPVNCSSGYGIGLKKIGTNQVGVRCL